MDNAELIRVLARVMEGKPPAKAFGAPGDWGYGTDIGKAIAAPESKAAFKATVYNGHGEYQTVPVEAAKRIALEFDKQQVVIIAVDHPFNQIHTATYGVGADDKVEAAKMGEFLTKQLGCDTSKSKFTEDFRKDLDAAKYKQALELLHDALCVLNAHAVGHATQKVIETFIKP